MSDNELIANFMGYDKVTVGYSGTDDETEWQKEHAVWIEDAGIQSVGDYAVNIPNDEWIDWEDINYDKDWNQIMFVVAKIGMLYNHAFPSGAETIALIMANKDPVDEHYIDVISISIATPIEEVYTAVVKFIKWYNSEKS